MLALSRSARTLAEIRALLALATPIIIAQLAYTSMGFVDTVMAGRVSARDLAGVALGNSLWVPVFLLMNGTLLATTAKVAQRFGAGRHEQIGPLVRQALWLALGIGLLATLLLFGAEPVLTLMGVEDSLRATARMPAGFSFSARASNTSGEVSKQGTPRAAWDRTRSRAKSLVSSSGE